MFSVHKAKCKISYFKVSQCNAAKYIRCDGSTNMGFIENLSLFAERKNFA